MTGDDWQFEGNEEDAALREEIEEMSDQRTRVSRFGEEGPSFDRFRTIDRNND